MDNSIKRTYIMYSLFSTAILAYGFILNEKTLDPPGHSCMFRSLFYIPCAGCGGSHAIQSLMSGSIVDAFRYNALISTVFISAILVMLLLIADFSFNKNYLVKINIRLTAAVGEKKMALAASVGLILFWLYHIWKF